MTAPVPHAPRPTPDAPDAPDARDLPAAAAEPGPATAVSPDARRLWRRGRGLLAAAVVLALAGLLIGLLRSGNGQALHPRSATDDGGRALAELLADRGVDVELATSAEEATDAAGPDSTLLVTRPRALTDAARAALRDTAEGRGRTVLLAPDQAALDALAPGTTAAEPSDVREREPRCADPAAERAGTVLLGGARYALPDGADATACYPVGGLPTLVDLGDTTLLGSPDLLRNDQLDRYGNASLALQLLGTHSHLVWYLPSAAEAPAEEEQESLLGLLDPGWRWAAAQLAVAVLLAAVWRARRLGPVVTERLPVAVRAAETTEGRARLYHRAGARDRAADALRHAARARLAPLLGVEPAAAHSADALPAAVAAHTAAPAPAVRELLFGPPPADDPELVRLAERLDALERRVGADLTGPHPTDRPQHWQQHSQQHSQQRGKEHRP